MFQGLQESQLAGAIEAMLFVTDEPVGVITLADMLEVDPAQVEAAFRFYADMFRKMELAGIDRLGGALYSYWPAQCTPETDKAADTDRSAACSCARWRADGACSPIRCTTSSSRST